MQERRRVPRSAALSGGAAVYPVYWRKVLCAVLVAIAVWLLIAGFVEDRIGAARQYAGSNATCARWQGMRPAEREATVRTITERVSATDTSLARVGQLRHEIEDACQARPHSTLRHVVDEFASTEHRPR